MHAHILKNLIIIGKKTFLIKKIRLIKNNDKLDYIFNINFKKLIILIVFLFYFNNDLPYVIHNQLIDFISALFNQKQSILGDLI